MRISSANIPARTNKPTPSSSVQAAGQSIDRRQASAAASDAKTSRQTSAQVIEAEFVEFYTPSTKVFDKERSHLDFAIEAKEPVGSSGPASTGSAPAKIGKYQPIIAVDTPRPGSFIDFYA